MDFATAALHWAYPPPAERGFLTDLPDLLLFLLPLALHALSIHLLLRHHTSPLANTLRAGLVLPLTVLASIRAGFGAVLPPWRFTPHPGGGPSWLLHTVGGEQTEGGFQHFHVAVGVYGAYSILKALEWGLARQPPRLRPELLQIYHLERKAAGTAGSGKAHANGSSVVIDTRDEHSPAFLPTFLPGTRIPLGLDLLTNMRGIGWEWGLPYHPEHTPIPRPQPGSPAAAALHARRAALIRTRLSLALRLFLFVDAIDSLLKTKALFGPRANVGGPLVLGGAATEALRYEEQPSPAHAWLLTLLAGLVIPTSMQATFSLLSALALLPAHFAPHADWLWRVGQADPAGWGVALFRRPHAPRDLRALWSAEWHALFRAPFLSVAYRPVNEGLKALGLGAGSSTPPGTAARHHRAGGSGGLWRGTPGKLLRRALSVLAVFTVSGLMHEAGQLAMGRTPAERDPRRLVGAGVPIVVYTPAKEAVAYVDTGGRALAFFVMQGVACIVEDAVEALWAARGRGRKARGERESPRGRLIAFLTWLWMAGWIFGWGHYVGKAWFRMGIAQGVVSMRLTGALAQLAWRALSRA